MAKVHGRVQFESRRASPPKSNNRVEKKSVRSKRKIKCRICSILVARHRREIQQMIESTRERSLAMNASIASTRSPPREKPMTPKKTFQRPSLPTKSEPSLKEKFNAFWTKYKSPICETLKALMIGTIFGAFLILLKSKGADLIPKRKGLAIFSSKRQRKSEVFSFSFRNKLFARKSSKKMRIKSIDERSFLFSE